MSEALKPLFALDIGTDGAWEPTQPNASIKGRCRWMHFDLATSELRSWCRKHLPQSATRNLLAAKTRPRVDQIDDGLFLTLRGVNLNEGDDRADMVSLRLWMTADDVISVRRQNVFATTTIRHQIEEGDTPDSPTALVARLAEHITTQIEDVADDLEQKASLLENSIDSQDPDLPTNIADLSRAVIKFRRHIGPQGDALQLLAEIESPAIEDKLRNRLRQIAGRTKRAQEELSEIRDRLTTLNEQLMMTQSARIGRNSYLLSVAAAIFLPLSFITSLVGLRFSQLPWEDHPQAFLLYCGGMVVLGLILFVIFRISRLL